MAILDSVKELASKLGAETSGRDITEQINLINKKLDETSLSGRDIAEAVRTYSENATVDVSSDNYSTLIAEGVGLTGEAIGFATPTNSELSINLGEYELDGYETAYPRICITAPIKKLVINIYQGYVYFIPTEDFDGFYYINGDQRNLTGDTVEKDGNTVYEAYFNSSPNVAIKKCNKSVVV